MNRAMLPPTLVGERRVDHQFVVTYGVINRLWCVLCDKSAHLSRDTTEIPPEIIDAMMADHRCGPRVSLWAMGWGAVR